MSPMPLPSFAPDSGRVSVQEGTFPGSVHTSPVLDHGKPRTRSLVVATLYPKEGRADLSILAPAAPPLGLDLMEVGQDGFKSLNLNGAISVRYHVSFTKINETSLMDCGKEIVPPLRWAI